MHPPRRGSALWFSRSYFVPSPGWSDNDIWNHFREWLVFDCFTMMNSHGTAHYDDYVHVMVNIPNEECSSGGRNAVNYGDVTQYLVRAVGVRPENLPKRSYAELYKSFLEISKKTKNAIEWFVSQPPAPRRTQPLFGQHWGILHMNVLIESLIGQPPMCCSSPKACDCCKRELQPHHKMSRQDWLREELIRRLGNESLAVEYASVIWAGKRLRDKMVHKPHIDRLQLPALEPSEIYSYAADRLVTKEKLDHYDLDALLVYLREIAHALLVDEAFHIKSFRPLPEMKVTVVQG